MNNEKVSKVERLQKNTKEAKSKTINNSSSRNNQVAIVGPVNKINRDDYEDGLSIDTANGNTIFFQPDGN